MNDGTQEKHSLIGIAAFSLSLIVGILMMAFFILAGILNSQRVEGARAYPGQTLVGLAIILLLGVDVLAVALGLATLFQKGTNRLFGIIGLAIAGLTIVGTMGLMLVGLIYMSRFSGRY